jgi:hypothetical protein
LIVADFAGDSTITRCFILFFRKHKNKQNQ